MENKQALAQAAIETIAMVCGQELLEEKSYKHNRTEIPDAVAVRLEMTGDIVGMSQSGLLKKMQRKPLAL